MVNGIVFEKCWDQKTWMWSEHHGPTFLSLQQRQRPFPKSLPFHSCGGKTAPRLFQCHHSEWNMLIFYKVNKTNVPWNNSGRMGRGWWWQITNKRMDHTSLARQKPPQNPKVSRKVPVTQCKRLSDSRKRPYNSIIKTEIIWQLLFKTISVSSGLLSSNTVPCFCFSTIVQTFCLKHWW